MCMKFWKKKNVFLDYASMTPLDKGVAKKMRAYEWGLYANPSALYTSAMLAKKAVDNSRQKVAEILNAIKSDIVFTSSGTESNNLALLGVFTAFKKEDFVPHFVTTTVEHPSVLEVFKEIERRGGEVSYVEVSKDGLVNPKDIVSTIKPNTVLISVMYANNEIGTVQPIHEISRAIKDWRNKNSDNHVPYFHTDASQASLYLPLNVHKLGVDMMTLDGIKMYGPRGFGMLYVKSFVKVVPIVFGGGQEKGLRSGTENVPAIVGFAEALKIAQDMREKESERLTLLRDYAIQQIQDNFKNAELNGSQENRLPNNINFCFKGLDAEFAVISLDVLGVSASYSSSCRTLKDDSSSYVIKNIGRKECELSSLRFTLGRESKKSDIDFLIKCLKKVIEK